MRFGNNAMDPLYENTVATALFSNSYTKNLNQWSEPSYLIAFVSKFPS